MVLLVLMMVGQAEKEPELSVFAQRAELYFPLSSCQLRPSLARVHDLQTYKRLLGGEQQKEFRMSSLSFPEGLRDKR